MIIFLAAMIAGPVAMSPSEELPTQGLLKTENIDCISKEVSPRRAMQYYRMARQFEGEAKAFDMEGRVATSCRKLHGWSDAQTRNAFRIAILGGWLLEDGLLDKISELGDFRPFLDSYYEANVSEEGRHILKPQYENGDMKRALDEAGFPADKDLREMAYNYWEWRGAIYDVEEDFVRGELRK